jgi:hypothetical protein
MSSRIHAVRPVTLIRATATVVAAVALLMPAVASAAGATTIHACVNKKSGAMRIVSAKAKCRRTEHKLSWSSAGPTGPAGAPGATGAAGAPGANGVGVDYASMNQGLTPSEGLTPLGAGEAGVVVISRALPAGTYFVNAKTVVGASKGKSPVFVLVICELVDSTGLPALVELGHALDFGEWAQALAKHESEYEGSTTLSMQGQLTATQPTTLALVCAPAVGGKEATVDAFASQLSALQTTAND